MGDPPPPPAGRLGGDAGPAPPAPSPSVVRSQPSPDVLRVLRRERPARRARVDAFRARADPGGRRGGCRGADVDGRGRSSSARWLAHPGAMAAPPAGRTSAGALRPASSRLHLPAAVPDRIRRGMAPTPSTGPTGSDMAGIGIYFAAAVLVPLLGGAALDRVLNTAPVFVLVGLVVGLVAGGAAVWLKVRELSK
ncbi:MAG: hypothetical protein E6I12_12670 [Chloroflexi bacterium]|nr:MAG: hypothetical protein E6I12_12670 [Chloroflexota bacterium]TMF76312.1 MAG: hypothetical protein E6I15_07210 [Chloroflexota bacterium]